MNARTGCLILFSAVAVTSAARAQNTGAPKFTKDQQLIIAAFELDVERVKILLDEGARPDARLGVYDQHLFEDKWTLGWSHIGSDRWNSLLALANSHRAPQPTERAKNTSEGLDAARNKRDSLDPKLILERDRRRIAIAKLLIASKVDLDLNDGYGATALYASIDDEYDELSLLLIASGAKVDTKTGIYIDGTGDITPLHHATSNLPVLEALLKRGANVNVKDTTGRTPLHWAAMHTHAESVRLLLNAGADPKAKDNEGRTPDYWCQTFGGPGLPENILKIKVRNLLDSAQSK